MSDITDSINTEIVTEVAPVELATEDMVANEPPVVFPALDASVVDATADPSALTGVGNPIYQING